MIEESGTVIKCDGEFADVETERKSSCGGCSATGVCGTAVLAKVFGNRRSIVRVVNSIAANEGDRVVVGLQDGALIRASLVFYIVPILGMLAGAILGEAVAEKLGLIMMEPFSIIGGLLGLISGFMFARRFSDRVRNDERYRVVMLRHENRSVAVELPQ